MSVFYKHPLPLPLGEVAEQSEDGEGKPGCNALSVAHGDSSPKGRAKGVYRDTKNGAHPPCLSLWERWPSKARTERGNQVQSPLSRLRRQLSQRESQGGCTATRKMARISLASLFGRGGRAKRGRRGKTGVQDPLSRLRRQLSQRESQGVVPFISAPPGSWYRSFPASASRPGALPAPTP